MFQDCSCCFQHGFVLSLNVDDFRTPRGLPKAQARDWKSGKVEARELYDHESDPGEMRNVAAEENYAGVLDRHQAILKAGWKKSLP